MADWGRVKLLKWIHGPAVPTCGDCWWSRRRVTKKREESIICAIGKQDPINTSTEAKKCEFFKQVKDRKEHGTGYKEKKT